MLESEYLGNYPDGNETCWSNKCQGVTHDEGYWYISQTLQLWKIPVSADLNFNVDIPEAQMLPLPRHLLNAGYDHFGDLDFWEGYLFISLENKNKRNPPCIVLWDTNKFEHCSVAQLPSPEKKDIPWCAINPMEGTLFTSDFKCKGELYEYDFSIAKNKKLGLKFLRKIQLRDKEGNLFKIKRVQGGVFSRKNKLLYISSDGAKQGGVFVFETEGFSLVEHIHVPYEPGFPRVQEMEGITIWDLDGQSAINKSDRIKGQLHVLLLDNDLCNDDIFFKHFRVPLERNDRK